VIRVFEASDTEVWAILRSRLWPDASPQVLALESRRFAQGHALANITAVFLAEDGVSIPVGFLELSVRAFADGCESMPVPHVEGWARSKGFVEIASDTEVENQGSRHAHAACGFMEVEHAVRFRKSLA
jgi:aminoglycoside 6'-N-acetyltransferase I